MSQSRYFQREPVDPLSRAGWLWLQGRTSKSAAGRTQRPGREHQKEEVGPFFQSRKTGSGDYDRTSSFHNPSSGPKYVG